MTITFLPYPLLFGIIISSLMCGATFCVTDKHPLTWKKFIHNALFVFLIMYLLFEVLIMSIPHK